MAVDTVSVFEHTIELTHVWLNDLMQRLGWHDKHRAYIAMRAVLHALRDRLSPEEAAHLAAQLPMLIRGFFYEGYHPAGKPLTERAQADFLQHVAAECGCENVHDGHVTRAVFEVLAAQIAPGEIKKVKAVLPPAIRSLWA